jgi:two-component system OmpR family sensor kinase
MSLRGRLLIAAAAMVLVALVVADVTTYTSLRSYLYDQLDRSLATAHVSIESAIEQAVNGPRSPRQDIVLAIPGAYAQVRDTFDQVTLRSTPGSSPPPQLPEHITLREGNGDKPTYFNAPSTAPGTTRYRVRVSSLPTGGQIVVAFPLSPLTSTLHFLAWVELAVAGLALAAVAALGWWLVRLSLRPLAEMEQTAAAITEGELSRRIPGDSAPTEVGRLARTLNTMLGRIQDAFAARDATEAELRQSEERLRRFVADASHELRTPLAAVGAYAELFDRGADERPQDLARVMSGIRAETARMGELVEDLLLLARLDEGRPLEHQAVELVGLAAEAARAAVAVGPEWPVRLAATEAVEVTGDSARLRQVLDNLLSNVRAHTPPRTSTQVRVTGQGDYGVIEVADNGPGLPDDALGLVFERFYRLDSSRSRNSGGSGLGLAIVSAIVAAQRGGVTAATTPGGGATFTVWLPLITAPEPVVAPDPAGWPGVKLAPAPPPWASRPQPPPPIPSPWAPPPPPWAPPPPPAAPPTPPTPPTRPPTVAPPPQATPPAPPPAPPVYATPPPPAPPSGPADPIPAPAPTASVDGGG